MVRIVSGSQDDDPNAALLQGLQLGRSFRQAREERAQAQRAQQDQAMQVMNFQMKFQEARAKREQLLNQQAEMGNAQALQEVALRAKLGPREAMMADGMKVLEGTKDPKARALVARSLESMNTAAIKEEKLQLAHTTIDKAATDGLIKPEQAPQLKTELQAGGDPDAMIKRLNDDRDKRDAAQVNTADAAQWIQKAQQQIEASSISPREKKMAMAIVQHYVGSPSEQSQPDTGAKMFADVDNALNHSRDKQIAEYIKTRKDKEYASNLSKVLNSTQDRYGAQEFPNPIPGEDIPIPWADNAKALGSGEADQPRTPAMQGHIDKQRAEKERRYPGSTAKRAGTPKAVAAPTKEQILPAIRQLNEQSQSPDQFFQTLQSKGIDPNSPEGAKLIIEALKGGNASEPAH